MLASWDNHWLREAQLISERSKDPSTKCGACIVDEKNRLVSKGYNGFPRGARDDISLYADREIKYRRIIHAEMNAILFAQRDLTGCALYVWPFLTCDRCATYVVQSGIVRVIAPSSDNPRWADAFEVALELYAEVGVDVTFY